MASAFTVVLGAAVGSSPPAAAIQADSRDDSLLIVCGTGTSTTTGIVCTVTYNANYSENVTGQTVPAVDVPILKAMLSTIGVNARSAGLYVSNVTTNTIVVSAATAPTASQASTLAGGGLVIVIRWDG